MALLDVCKVMLASLLGAVCIKGNCESPPFIQNAHVETPENGRSQNTPTYEVGTIIQFACNEGYAISGQNTMECRINGEWLTSTPPTCSARDCGEFGSIQDADLFQDSSFIERNHYGSVVQVTCLNGTTLIGPSQVKCQANGEWGLTPTCEDVQCPPYPKPDSSCISELHTVGVYSFINCVKDVSTHFGPNVAECKSGQWDTTEMGCLCDCILPEYNSSSLTLNGLNSHGNLPHATMLDWTCHDDSDKSSLKLVMCLDGKFNIQDDQDNDMIYSNPSDFTRVILPQLCTLPTLVSSSSSSPSTTTSTTLSSSSFSTKTSLISILTAHLRMTQTTAMTMVSLSIPTTLSSSEMSLRTSLSNSTTAYSKMSTRVTVPSQSVTRSSSISTSVKVSQKPIRSSSTLSSSETISFQSMTSSSKTPQITMPTPVTLSPQSITPLSTMSTTVTVSSSTMSTPVTGSSQSITPSSTMSTPVTASSQSITPSSTMSTPVKVSSQSITPSSTMPTPVTASSQSKAPSSTMSTPVTTVPVYSTSSSMPTPLNDATTTTTTTATYGVQNRTLYNAKVTDSTSRGQINVTASTDNESKDYINSGTIHFDFFLGSNICCIFQMFHIIWLKL